MVRIKGKMAATALPRDRSGDGRMLHAGLLVSDLRQGYTRPLLGVKGSPREAIMPIYEFHCPKCGKDFEELVRAPSRQAVAACPGCGSKRTERKISPFAAHSSAPAAACPLAAGGACARRCEPGEPCGLL